MDPVLVGQAVHMVEQRFPCQIQQDDLSNNSVYCLDLLHDIASLKDEIELL
jgi:hypothetical protein